MPDDVNKGRSHKELGSIQAARVRAIGALNWMFRSRATGRFTVAQLPNAPLLLWAAATAGRRLGDPGGWVRELLIVVAAAALGLWAAAEVLSGVNPFRRLVGGAVLAWLVYSLVSAA